MLAADVNAARGVGNSVAKGFPGFAVVSGHENINGVVVGAVAIKRGVSRAFSILGSENPADVDSLGHTGNTRRHILPVLASVTADLQIPVIRSDPQNIFGEWRFADGGDAGIFLDTIMAREGGLIRHLAKDRQFVSVDGGSQFRAQADPGVAAIGGLKEIGAAVIDGFMVVRRNE